jgi:hypothetical protein
MQGGHEPKGESGKRVYTDRAALTGERLVERAGCRRLPDIVVAGAHLTESKRRRRYDERLR